MFNLICSIFCLICFFQLKKLKGEVEALKSMIVEDNDFKDVL